MREVKHRKQREEYEAQAMLLGLTYDGVTHSMWGAAMPDSTIVEFDADTLERLTRTELIARADRHMEEEGIASVTPDDGYHKR